MRRSIEDEPENPQAAIDEHVCSNLVPALQENSMAALAKWMWTYAELGDLRPSLDYQKDTVLKALKSSGYTVAGVNGEPYPPGPDSNAIRNTIYTLETFGRLPDPLLLRTDEIMRPPRTAEEIRAEREKFMAEGRARPESNVLKALLDRAFKN